MTAQRRKRSGVSGLFVFVAGALLCLFLGHRWLTDYAEQQKTSTTKVADMPGGTGVSGVVSFADGARVAAARVDIEWVDSGGRRGSTPALTDGQGRFVQPLVPAHVKLERITASTGPLAADAPDAELAGDPAAGVRATIALPATFRLAGLVRRASDRAPVAGAKLSIGGITAVSDKDGAFVLDAVPAKVLLDEKPIVQAAADGMKSLDWPLPLDDPAASYGDLKILLESSP